MRFERVGAVLFLTAVLAGCQTKPADNPSPSGMAAVTDPCATQLHDIAGDILLYYALNKRMPAELTDLQTVADADTPLHFECPVSGLRYLYYPLGLMSPDGMGAIIVCDPTPAHDGKRWCIVEGVAHGKSLSLDVEELPEAIFRQFGPAGGQ